MTPVERALVDVMRQVCAIQLGGDPAYPWFWRSYPRDGSVATSDEALLAIFNAERDHHDTAYEALLVLCHG